MFDKNLWEQAKRFGIPLSLTIILGGLIGGLVVIQAWLVSQVIAGVFLDGTVLGDIRTDLAFLFAIILLRSAAAFGRELTAGSLSVSVRSSLREKLFSHLLALGPAVLEQERSGELSNVLVQGIERLDSYFREYLPQLALSALVPAIVLTVVFPLDWLTGLIFLLTAPLIPLFMVLIGKQAEHETQRQWGLLSRLSAHFLDVLQGLTTLKRFGLSKNQTGVINKTSEQYAQATLRVLRIAFLSALVLEILATISTAIVAVQIGLRLMYAQMAFVDALFILILAPEFYFPLRQLGASFHAGMEGISAAERIFGVFSLPLPPSGKKTEVQIGDGIRFQHVRYAYQDGERPSLESVDLELFFGQRTALVGASGAGKTTIAKLLLGFLRPDEGQILVGGTPLSEVDASVWREQVAWVPQFPYLFNASVEENIRLAKPHVDLDQVVQAARQANADGFIQDLPEGYQTLLGERGARLSGGQAQRIALARVFLKDAPLLVLDEPGENLDPENTELLHQALDRVLSGRTSLIIAHRLSTIKAADQIVVLDGGQVVQVGKHVDLLNQEGLYRNFVQASAGGTA
jgi:thiol reductant ABC exporter CydD subunit